MRAFTAIMVVTVFVGAVITSIALFLFQMGFFNT
jgi:hypothetical protein